MTNNGVTGAASVSMPVLMTMAGFLAISFYNVIELFVIIFTTFKQRSGLYFWSFVVATAGIAPHALGFVLKFFGLLPDTLWWVPVLLVAVGFPAMVTGQSAVLYSRLHLVMRDERRLRWVRAVVVADGIVLSVPLAVLAFGSNSPAPDGFLPGFTVWDKIQIAVFAVQEIAISLLYIYETAQLLRAHRGPASATGVGPRAGRNSTASGRSTSSRALRKILVHLVAVNIMVLAFDVTLLGVQYSNQYEIQTTYKGAVYSIKLKLEFSVLNNLISVIKDRDVSFGGRAAGSTTSRRFDSFTIGGHHGRSRGSFAAGGAGGGNGEDAGGPFERIEDEVRSEAVLSKGTDGGYQYSERRLTGTASTVLSLADDNDDSIGIAFRPTQPLPPEDVPDVELVMLENGRVVPRNSVLATAAAPPPPMTR